MARAGACALLGRPSTVAGTDFLALLEEWFMVARAMGELENERATNAGERPSAADVVAARNHWIRAVRLFIAPLRMRDDVPERVVAILDRVEAAAAAAARRRGRRRKAAQPASQAPVTAPVTEPFAASATGLVAAGPATKPAKEPVARPDRERPAKQVTTPAATAGAAEYPNVPANAADSRVAESHHGYVSILDGLARRPARNAHGKATTELARPSPNA